MIIGNTDYIVIPTVYDKFTKKNSKILVMDFLHGIKLSNVNEYR